MNYACLYNKCLQDPDGSDSSIVWNVRPGGRPIFGSGAWGGALPPHAYSWSRHCSDQVSKSNNLAGVHNYVNYLKHTLTIVIVLGYHDWNICTSAASPPTWLCEVNEQDYFVNFP